MGEERQKTLEEAKSRMTSEQISLEWVSGHKFHFLLSQG